MKKLNTNKKTKTTGPIRWSHFKKLFLAIILLSTSMEVNAQTTVLDPNGAGGFELGTTFAANGWTEAQDGGGTANKWYVGTAFKVGAGTRGAYISNNGGTSHAYSITSARTQHIYRNVTFPAGQTGITLTFNWKCNGENDTGNDEWDFLRVYLVSTSTTPSAASYLPAGNIIGSIKYNLQNTNQTATITIPASFAGTTQRLVFTWRNDGSAGSQTPAGIDNISIVTCTLPVASASNNGPLCVGNTLNLTASGGSSYSWTGPNSFTSSSQNPSVTNMTVAKAGLYTVNVTNSCGTSSASTTVAVNSGPTGSATVSSSSVCPGTTVTLSANQTLQTTGQNLTDFSIPDNSNTGVNSPITISGTGLTAAAAIVNVQITVNHNTDDQLDIFLKAPNGSQIELSSDNGGSGNNYTNTIFQTGGSSITSGSAPFTGTYAPEQAFSGLTGSADGTWNLFVRDDAFFTTGSIVEWFITVRTTSGVTYAWSSTPSGFSSTSANPVANPTANSTYQVIATGNGCAGAPSSVSVTTLTPPVAVASSNTPVCEGSDLNLNASGGTSYAWTGPSFSASTQNPTISGATTAATGNYTVVVTNAFGCTDAETISVTVNDKPEVSVLTQTDVTCNGGSDGAIALDVTGGTAPFLFYDGANFSFDGTFSGYTAGSVSVTVTDDNGCEDIIGFNITEPGPISIADAGSDQLLCNSGTASVTGNTPTVGVGTWTIQNGTAAISNPSSPSTGLTGMAPGNIVLRYTIAQAGCGSNYDEVTLINNAGPPAQPGSISGVNIACPPLNGQVFSISPVADATSYQWFAGPGSTGINFASATNSTSVTVDFGATTNSGYTLRVVAVNGCGAGNYSSSSIRRTVSTPQLTGPTLACANETKVFTIPTPIVGATNYIWSVPAGATIDGNAGPFTTTNTTVNIAFPSVFTSGNVCVKAVGPCGIETTNRCITVSSIPARPVRVNGLNTACPGSTQSYSVPAVAGAVSYNWTLPAHATIISGAGTNSVTISFANNYTGGNICASATNPCTTGTQECINVQRAIPSMPSYISGIAFGLCGTTQTYSIPADPSVLTYNWTVPSGAVITNGAGTNTVEVNMAGVSFPTAGNQYLQISVAKVNACAVGVPRVLNIQGVPQKATSISGPTGVCASESGITYSCPNMFGATNYQWNVPSGVSILAGQGTNSIVVEWGISPGVISVTASNSCGNSGTRTLPVAINCRVAGETSKSVKLLAYPNPASDEVTVYFESNTEASTQFEILDVMGRVIKSQNIIPVVGSNEIVIDLTGFAKGAYLVQLKSNEISSQTRLIVE